MVERPVSTHEAMPPREPMDDIELGNLLASVGNSETKAITLLVMKPGVIHPRGDLHRRFLSIQEASVGWKMSHQTPFAYCLQSFAPIGLVAQEYIDPIEGLWGYKITEYGEDVGISLAGYLLDFSLHHDVSLRQLLGSTVSHSPSSLITTSQGEDVESRKRSPLTRVQLLRVLRNSDKKLRHIDIATEMNEASSVVEKHIHTLAGETIISHDAIEQNKPRTFYQLKAARPPDSPPGYRRQPTLTQEIYAIVSTHGHVPLSTEAVVDLLIEGNPKRESLSRGSLRSNTNAILSHLVKGDYLIRQKFSKTVQSEVFLTSVQREVIDEFLTLLDRFKTQTVDVLREGKNKALRMLSNPAYVSALTKKAKETSPNANRISVEESLALVLSTISNHPGITNAELHNMLQTQGVHFGRDRIWELTRFFEKEGRVTTKRKGTVKHYFPLS